jgi:membrane protein implicated in regulation of membrane protease activity
MDLFIAYLVCFGVGLLFTIVSAVMADVFGGHDAGGTAGAGGHAEAGFDSNDMPGFSPLSPTTIAAFATAFGGFGMVFSKIEATKSPWLSVPLSLVAGFLVALAMFMMFRAIFNRTQSSSEARVSRLVGTTGTVITPIPANGVGEVAYVTGGSRYTAPARSVSGAEVANGAAVRIARIVGSQFYVETI